MLEKIRATICAWFGHSRVSTGCLGYQYCGRCGTQVGDTLGSIGVAGLYYPIHRNQKCCREAKAMLTWKDWLLVPKKIRDEEEITPEMAEESKRKLKRFLNDAAAKRASR